MKRQVSQQPDPSLESSTESIHFHRGSKTGSKSIKHGTIVVKIGGSTLGDHDTTMQDLVELQSQGINSIVVHGGGKVISDWMIKQGIRPKFVGGLRVTDQASLDIVVAVLTGLVNKGLVASISALGGKAMGISGADDGMLEAEIKDPELGFVGRLIGVNSDPIEAVLKMGCIPVIAPVSINVRAPASDAIRLLNVNADTVAGAIAAKLGADRLVFLTDVEGVLDSSKRLIPRLTARQTRGLMKSNVVAGGMIPKLQACLTAIECRSIAQIMDGRKPHALLKIVSGDFQGTRVG